MRPGRILGGVAVLFVDALVIAFVVQANYGSLAAHPARIIIAVLVIGIAVALLVLGLRLVLSGARSGA